MLSHLHGDQFDRVARAELPRQPPVVTTPQAARRLGGWGLATRPLDTWPPPSSPTATSAYGSCRCRRCTHLDDAQGVELVTRLRPRQVVPVHHSDYPVFRSPLSAFLHRPREQGLASCVTQVAPGETIPLG